MNVFLGQNNSGKSSVLEAIRLLTGLGNPSTPQNINSLRTRNPFSAFKDVYYLFYNMDVKTPIEIASEQFDDIARKFRLSLSYVFDTQNASQTSSMNGAMPVSENKSFFNTLLMDFDLTSEKGTQSHQSSLTVNSEGIVTSRKLAEDYLEKNNTVYLTADLWGFNLAIELSELFKRKQKKIILERLSYFYSRIKDIDILGILIQLYF